MITTIGPADARIGPPNRLVWGHRRMALVIDTAAFPKMQYHGRRGRMRATAEVGMDQNKASGLLGWWAEVTLGTDTHQLFERVRGEGLTPEEAVEEAFAEVDARAAVLALELRGA